MMKYKLANLLQPLQEGKIPTNYVLGPDGHIYAEIPEAQDREEYDPWEGQVHDTDTWFLSEGREEYWGFETICKACGTRWMAYKDHSQGYNIRNYCPGCGKKLDVEGDK